MFEFKYNEKKYAEHILKNGFSTKHLNNELRVLSKYYKELGHKPREREELLYKFCEENLEGFSKVEYFKRINAALNHAKKKENKLIEINEIHISKEELETVDQAEVNSTCKKVLFTLLVLNKLNKTIQEIKFGSIQNKENYFGGNTRNYKELVDSGGISVGRNKKFHYKNIHEVIGELAKEGFVEIRGSGFIKLSFVYEILEDDSVVMTISSFDNIGLYYDLHTGEEKVKECESCKIPIVKKNNKTKYCNDCSREINIRKTIQNRKNKSV